MERARQRRRVRLPLVLLAAFLGSVHTARAAAPQACSGVEDLGVVRPNHTGAHARAVSADGSTVVGVSGVVGGSNPWIAFSWSPSTGFLNLGRWNPVSASPDGGVVVGSAVRPSTGVTELVRWTEAGGLQWLAPDPTGTADPTDASAATDVIVGITWDPSYSYSTGFRWTQATGFQSIPLARIEAISSDGSVIVGSLGQYFGTGPQWITPAIWTAGGGVQSLSSSSSTVGEVLDVSANGDVVVGWVGDYYQGGAEAFRWTAQGGFELLGELAGDDSSRATAVSDDGSVVLGVSIGRGGHRRPFRWTTSTGLVALTLPAGVRSCRITDTDAAGRLAVGVAADRALRWVGATSEVICDSGPSIDTCDHVVHTQGMPSVSSGDPFVLRLEGVQRPAVGVLAYSTSTAHPGAGTLCLAGPLRRLVPVQSMTPHPWFCPDGELAVDFNAHIRSGSDPGLVPGVSVSVQYWWRDAAGQNAPRTSDAIRFVLCP